MEMELIQYIRKNGGIKVKVDGKPAIKRSKGKKCGVLFCGINPDDNQCVIVGFSLCNKRDRFDYIFGKDRCNGLGIHIAQERALQWTNHNHCFIQHLRIHRLNANSKDIVEIPPSIVKDLFYFIERCKKYYKDKKFPAWVSMFEEYMSKGEK